MRNPWCELEYPTTVSWLGTERFEIRYQQLSSSAHRTKTSWVSITQALHNGSRGTGNSNGRSGGEQNICVYIEKYLGVPQLALKWEPHKRRSTYIDHMVIAGSCRLCYLLLVETTIRFGGMLWWQDWMVGRQIWTTPSVEIIDIIAVEVSVTSKYILRWDVTDIKLESFLDTMSICNSLPVSTCSYISPTFITEIFLQAVDTP